MTLLCIVASLDMEESIGAATEETAQKARSTEADVKTKAEKVSRCYYFKMIIMNSVDRQ